MQRDEESVQLANEPVTLASVCELLKLQELRPENLQSGLADTGSFRLLAWLLNFEAQSVSLPSPEFGYETVADYAAREFLRDIRSLIFRWRIDAERAIEVASALPPDRHLIPGAYDFIKIVGTIFAEKLHEPLFYSDEGLPLYILQDGRPLPIECGGEIASFVTNMVRFHQYRDEYYDVPDWALLVFTKKEDWRVFRIFYYDLEDIESRNKKKAYFRAAIRAILNGRIAEQPDPFRVEDVRSFETPNAKRESSYIAIIQALCKAADIDPASGDAVREVSRWLDAVGKSMDAKTIRSILRGNQS